VVGVKYTPHLFPPPRGGRIKGMRELIEPVDRSTKCKKGRIFREKFGRTLTFK